MGVYWAFQAFPIPATYWAAIFALLVKVLAAQGAERYWRGRFSHYPRVIPALVWILCYTYCTFFYGLVVILGFIAVAGQPPVVSSLWEIARIGMIPALLGSVVIEVLASIVASHRNRRTLTIATAV